jgi:hypothetical protein
MPKSLTGDVAIVGGALAGLATGIGLARRGLPVDVFEQNAGEERGGTGLGVDRTLITETMGVDAHVDGITRALPVVGEGAAVGRSGEPPGGPAFEPFRSTMRRAWCPTAAECSRVLPRRGISCVQP